MTHREPKMWACVFDNSILFPRKCVVGMIKKYIYLFEIWGAIHKTLEGLASDACRPTRHLQAYMTPAGLHDACRPTRRLQAYTTPAGLHDACRLTQCRCVRRNPLVGSHRRTVLMYMPGPGHPALCTSTWRAVGPIPNPRTAAHD